MKYLQVFALGLAVSSRPALSETVLSESRSAGMIQKTVVISSGAFPRSVLSLAREFASSTIQDGLIGVLWIVTDARSLTFGRVAESTYEEWLDAWDGAADADAARVTVINENAVLEERVRGKVRARVLRGRDPRQIVHGGVVYELRHLYGRAYSFPPGAGPGTLYLVCLKGHMPTGADGEGLLRLLSSKLHSENISLRIRADDWWFRTDGHVPARDPLRNPNRPPSIGCRL